MRRKQFDAIAKWVRDKGSIEAFNRFRVVPYFKTGGRQRFDQARKIADEQSGMRLPGRTKIRFHTKMQLQRATLKPGTTSSSKIWRFGNLGQSKQLAVKPTCQCFSANRNGQLNMVDAVYGHYADSANSADNTEKMTSMDVKV